MVDGNDGQLVGASWAMPESDGAVTQKRRSKRATRSPAAGPPSSSGRKGAGTVVAIICEGQVRGVRASLSA